MADLQDTTSVKEQKLEEVRQQLLAHLDASKDAIGELSEEELESVAGGGFTISFGGGPKGGTGTGGGSIDTTTTSNNVFNRSKSNSQSIGVGSSQVEF